MRAPPAFPPPGSFRAKLANGVSNLNALVFKATGGRMGNKMSGGDVLLLDHVGRKSGKVRTAPLMYARDGENLIIVASRGGSDAPPAWLLNLRAHPRTTVQIGRERFDMVAREAAPEERERLWKLAGENYPYFDVYQSRTGREIAVLVLSPETPSHAKG